MRSAILLLLLLASAAPLPAQQPSATIYRDPWGVPHVFAGTDAGAVFGMAYALAEDDWPLIEENYLHALGRAAELRGESVLRFDWYARALETVRFSELEYRRAPARQRALLDAYAAGLNAWLDRNPDPGRTLVRVEPWYPLALIRFKYYVLEFLGYAGLTNAQTQRLLEHGVAGQATTGSIGSVPRFPAGNSPLRDDFLGPWGDRPFGSNQWAVAPSRTRDGHALLLINPHQSFVGVQRYAEIHLHSEEGLRFSGLTVFGFLLPYMGNSDRHGWAYTDNYADHSDLYAESFVDRSRYRYGKELRTAESWTDTIYVRGGAGLEPRTFRFWKTHHGPIVGLDERERPLAAKLARYEEGGWYEQWDAMIRARTLEEWKQAAGMLRVAYMNTMYADREGNIGYVYGSAVPRRLDGIDPSGILDGSDPRTEWQGFHTFSELPQVFNPASGWLLNTNSSPFHATRDLPFDRSDFPHYMVGSEINNPRAVSSARVLETLRDATFDEFTRAVVDTRLSAADTILPRVEEAARTESLQPAVRDALARVLRWDRRADARSVETTWFVLALERQGESFAAGLEAVLAELQARFGTTEVSWGEVNRLQRPLPGAPVALDPTRPSLGVHGAPSALGSVFVFHTEGYGAVRPRLGVHGNSFVKAIEFGPTVRARSILNYGQSGDPRSPHFFDQANLYARGEFKPAWFTREEVERNAVRKYEVR